MHRASSMSVVTLAAAAALAGCGSSTSSTHAGASSASQEGNGYGSAAASSVSTPAPAATPAALITTKHDKLGTVVAFGPKRLTVYLFEGDKPGTSSCSGTCAKVWPPVLGKPQATGGANGASLGTIKRPDGSTQVTYAGHPLYLFVKDKDDGDTYGEGVKGFGASWYALAPTGQKVDRS